ncbi:MAG: sulfatase-like hydrolase/transferase, partial [Planctomycetota bacterium]
KPGTAPGRRPSNPPTTTIPAPTNCNATFSTTCRNRVRRASYTVDQFFGYYDQVHAHTYYPRYLIENSRVVSLSGNEGGSVGTTYSHYVILDAAKRFIRKHRERPFFCYLPVTPPHGLFDLPDDDPAWKIYKDEPWPNAAKRYAAMVTMLDRQVGEILDLLGELGLREKTLVIFCGDNGGDDYFRSKKFPRGFHGPNVDPKSDLSFRGRKRSLYEGGLRIPMLARWPGTITPGAVSDHLWYFPDVFPTLAELAGAKAPKGLDGLSIVPTLIGERLAGRKQMEHDYLYWEFRGQTAVRSGRWKAIQAKANKPWELYDVEADPGETRDLSDRESGPLSRLKALAKAAHTPVREGTFHRTDLHENDRRAKRGAPPLSSATPSKVRQNP